MFKACEVASKRECEAE